MTDLEQRLIDALAFDGYKDAAEAQVIARESLEAVQRLRELEAATRSYFDAPSSSAKRRIWLALSLPEGGE